MENEPIKGYIRLTKTDSMNGMPIAGVQFDIYDASGALIGTMTTDENGVAVSPLMPYGVYRVDETKVPEHFVDNDFSTEMVINEENFCTYEIDVENEPIPSA